MAEGIATLQPYKPSFRERSTAFVANTLRDKMGMDNYRSYELARSIFGDSSTDTMGLASFSPAEAVYAGEEALRDYRKSDTVVGKGIAATDLVLNAASGIPLIGPAAKTMSRTSKQILKELPESDVQNLSFLIHEKQAAGIPTESLGSVEKALDLSKGNSTKTPLYRGVYEDELQQILKSTEDVKSGGLIRFDRYKSFSEKPDIAKKFGGTNVVLKANSSEGGFNYGDFVQESMRDYKKKSPADYDREDGDFISDFAKKEAEWIFGRNKGFKITDVKKEGDFLVVEGDIVD